MSFYFTIIACQFHCINIRNFITLNVWGKYKRSFFDIVTVLFTKPSSSILPAVGMTSETVPAAGPIHGLQCYSQSCWFLSYWPFPKNCWPEHPPEAIPASGSHWQPMDTFLFHKNCTSWNHGMTGNHEAGYFVNSAVNLIYSVNFWWVLPETWEGELHVTSGPFWRPV